MTNFSMLAICLLAGMLLRVTRRVPDNARLTLNGFVIHVALPGLILGQIHGLRLTTNLLWPASMPWLLFMLSAVAFTVLARVMQRPRSTTGALVTTTGLANTWFVGLPMIAPRYQAADQTTQVTLFESAMGPQIGSPIVAMQYGLNPTLIILMVGTGTALSFLTLPLWYLAMAAV